MSSEFKVIPGLDGKYSINESGSVIGPKGHLLKPFKESGGYLHFGTNDFGNISLHRAIKMAFDPVDKMHELCVDHIDGNKYNNTLSNLRWVTARENALHNVTLGIHIYGDRHGCAKLTSSSVLEIRSRYKHKHNYSNAADLAKEFGVSRGAIVKAATGRSWKHLKEPK